MNSAAMLEFRSTDKVDTACHLLTSLMLSSPSTRLYSSLFLLSPLFPLPLHVSNPFLFSSPHLFSSTFLVSTSE